MPIRIPVKNGINILKKGMLENIFTTGRLDRLKIKKSRPAMLTRIFLFFK
jgi:hypothetical protein